ncbi:MAG: hypothetical protein ACXVVQ_04270 [Solirubrobacteraceae bacterium]
MTQAVNWIKRVLNDHTYAQGCCYIVGIGNEENNLGVSTSTYKAIYDQVAPIAARDSYGFIAAPELNWNTSWLSSWMKSEGGHPPDLSIVSGHAYPGLVSEPGYARALESYGYYTVFSEGVCGGPNTWEQYGALPYSQARNLGALFSLEWAATNGSPC